MELQKCVSVGGGGGEGTKLRFASRKVWIYSVEDIRIPREFGRQPAILFSILYMLLQTKQLKITYATVRFAISVWVEIE